jgi:hypothetical protein
LACQKFRKQNLAQPADSISENERPRPTPTQQLEISLNSLAWPLRTPQNKPIHPLMTTATAKMLRLKWRALIELAPARRT